MSRTDKDRPYWVRTWQDRHFIDHDHRFGECVEETLAYAKGANGRSWQTGHKHWRVCKKRVTEVFTCTKREPYLYTHHAYYWRTNWERTRTERECWTWRCRCDVPRSRRHTTPMGPFYREGHQDACPTWGRVQCDGHEITTYDRTIPCSCDERPQTPTCDMVPEQNRARYCWGGVPTAFVRTVYHGPERAKERKLKDMAREYNAYGDIEDYDFVNRQGRSSARWDWW